MECFTFAHLPHELQAVHVALFRQVTNAKALKQRLIDASKMPEGPEGDQEREHVDFCFIDASKIASLTHLITAVHCALMAAAQGQLKAQTPHSEILYQLTPTKNIVEGLKNFGVSASTSDLVAVKICSPSTSSSSVLDQLHQAIQGQISDVTLIGTSELIALGPLTKMYKLSEEETQCKKRGEQAGTAVKTLAPSIVVGGLSA